MAQTDKYRLTSQEREEIKDKARWLRRIANPFLDFYVILAVGVTGSPTAAEVTQRRHEDKQIRDHAKELYARVVSAGCTQLTRPFVVHRFSVKFIPKILSSSPAVFHSSNHALSPTTRQG